MGVPQSNFGWGIPYQEGWGYSLPPPTWNWDLAGVPPTPPRERTGTCENITSRCTMYVGGKNGTSFNTVHVTVETKGIIPLVWEFITFSDYEWIILRICKAHLWYLIKQRHYKMVKTPLLLLLFKSVKCIYILQVWGFIIEVLCASRNMSEKELHYTKTHLYYTTTQSYRNCAGGGDIFKENATKKSLHLSVL